MNQRPTGSKRAILQRAERKAAGLCTECPNPPQPALANHTLCELHAQKRIISSSRYRENHPDAVELQNQVRIAKDAKQRHQREQSTYWAYISRLKNKYGITEEQHKKMLVDQDHKCAICRTDTPPLCVDHCHYTNNVRGILCSACNKGLGAFKDKPELLIEAASYLRKSTGYVAPNPPTHTCSKCSTSRPLTQFNKDRTKASGHSSWCKKCKNGMKVAKAAPAKLANGSPPPMPPGPSENEEIISACEEHIPDPRDPTVDNYEMKDPRA